MTKRLICLLMTLAFVLTLAPAAFAADTMQSSRFYSNQERSCTCTLASATMMLRRRAYLDGNADFADITESSVRKKAWWDGLVHNFTYQDMTVGYGTISGEWEDREAQLIALLAEHPEGIVAYDRTTPHAILLTDYTDGVFYCSDPARDRPADRMPADSASISLTQVSCYWYISEDANPQYGTIPVDKLTLSGLFYPGNLCTGDSFELGGTLRCAADDTILQVELQILDTAGTILQYASIQPDANTREWEFRDLNQYITFGDLAAGSYYFYFVAKDSAGDTITFAQPFAVTQEATHTLYYWSNIPAIAG